MGSTNTHLHAYYDAFALLAVAKRRRDVTDRRRASGTVKFKVVLTNLLYYHLIICFA